MQYRRVDDSKDYTLGLSYLLSASMILLSHFMEDDYNHAVGHLHVFESFALTIPSVSAFYPSLGET